MTRNNIILENALFAIKSDTMNLLCCLLIIVILLSETSGQNSVSQHPVKLQIQEDQTATLNCSYTTEYAGETLFWYIQYPGKSPKYILKRYGKEQGMKSSDFSDRFTANLDKESKVVPLTITGVHISDSAIYFCALSSTVIRRHIQHIQKRGTHTHLHFLDLIRELNREP
ncbi:hypothetical protein chiPu_0019533 [Chiloscyllium punctatum]|uniref:Ig-like domain-containing protein n=1 Tax=Chiloscyllium punctatum TaxID=137246 RepID=A0A401RSF9_CHIPU|nr:hypothetical protein [Chiloscyllium punctatum]